MPELIPDFLDFIEKSPTSFHTVREIGNRLASQDFMPLDETERWELELGQGYFVEKGGALCAFRLPKNQPEKATILASHTDSPALKLKPNPLFIKDHMAFCKVEVYGGPILHSYLNRDLAMSGRLVYLDENKELAEKLVHLDDMPMIIPELAIHLNREVNSKPSPINKEEHLCPLIGLHEKLKFQDLFKQYIKPESLLSFDLFLVPMEKPRLLGNGELLASYRLDNLASTHAILAALMNQKASKDTIQLAVFWNHEEIGSETEEGAASPFLSDLLKRIAMKLNIDWEGYMQLKARSTCYSLDMTHAFHPGFKDKHDKQNTPFLGKGVTIKHNANHKFASNAETAGEVLRICKDLNLPFQLFSGRADIRSGSTVGPIHATTLGIPTVDLGIPQLSMHATREVMALADFTHAVRLVSAIINR